MPLPIPRRYSKVEVPIHFIWGTLDRRPILIPPFERHAHRVIQSKAQQLEATVLALDGMPDHVHLAVLFSPNVTIASFVRQVKRAATIAIREQHGDQLFFAWEPGYAAFAFPFGKRQEVIDYIRNQKTHHGNERTIAYWEEIGEWRSGDVPSSGGSLRLVFPAGTASSSRQVASDRAAVSEGDTSRRLPPEEYIPRKERLVELDAE